VRSTANAMRVLPTTLDGVLLLELDAFDDARGRVIEQHRCERSAKIGLTAELVQDTFTRSGRGTLRGWRTHLEELVRW